MSLDNSQIIAFDLETTGTNTSTDQIVQIAYGYYENGALKDSVTKLFKPTIAERFPIFFVSVKEISTS